MYILINLLILFITLFLYIHIYYHIKTSNYLEIYEIDNLSKEKLEELCNLKQPIILNNTSMNFNTDIIKTITTEFLEFNYGTFDIKIINKENTTMSLPMNLSTALALFKKDFSANYISEYNNEFLDETTIEKSLSSIDIFLRPYNVTNIYYDIIFGAINSYTNLKYTLNCRNFFFVNSGKVEITLCPPKNFKYLYINDYDEQLEYCSLIDINNVDDVYKKDFDKVKFLRVILLPEQLIQIPAYWFYSIKLLEENSIVFSFKYRTFMNSLAISPQLFTKFLQDNNIKRNLTKIVDA